MPAHKSPRFKDLAAQGYRAITGVDIPKPEEESDEEDYLVEAERLLRKSQTTQADDSDEDWGEGADGEVAFGNGRGSGLNQFDDPADVVVDANGNAFVLDRGNARVLLS